MATKQTNRKSLKSVVAPATVPDGVDEKTVEQSEELAEKILGQPVGRELVGSQLVKQATAPTAAEIALEVAVDGMIEPYFRLFEQYTADVGVLEVDGNKYVLGSLLDLTGPQMEGGVAVVQKIVPGFFSVSSLSPQEFLQVAVAVIKSGHMPELLTYAYRPEIGEWNHDEMRTVAFKLYSVTNAARCAGILIRFFSLDSLLLRDALTESLSSYLIIIGNAMLRSIVHGNRSA